MLFNSIVMKFYFFKSSCKNDMLNNIIIFTTNHVKAFALARMYFIKNKCKGEPTLLVI